MGDVLTFFERASSESPLTPHDPKFLRAMGLIVPKNSGIQTVYKNILLSINFARYQHWRFRPYAHDLAKAREYGLVAITSEQGGGIRTFNTERMEHILPNQNHATQKADSWDRAFYGDKVGNN